jgi:hypothetical protein
MSKMPPQGSCSIPQILDLFFSHVANIEKPHLNPLQRRGLYYIIRIIKDSMLKPLSLERGWGEAKMPKGL